MNELMGVCMVLYLYYVYFNMETPSNPPVSVEIPENRRGGSLGGLPMSNCLLMLFNDQITHLN